MLFVLRSGVSIFTLYFTSSDSSQKIHCKNINLYRNPLTSFLRRNNCFRAPLLSLVLAKPVYDELYYEPDMIEKVVQIHVEKITLIFF